MIFCIEGVDGTGKSTLAKLLNRELGQKNLEVRHSPQPTKRDYKNMVPFYMRGLEICRRKHLAMDRWWPSHIVYQSIFNKQLFLRREYAFLMESFALTFGLHYVYCKAERKELLKRIAKSDDTPERRNNQAQAVAQLENLYEKFFADRGKSGKIWTTVYDSTLENAPAVAYRLAMQSRFGLLETERRTRLRVLQASGWGAVNPTVLILGDRTPVGTKTEEQLIAFHDKKIHKDRLPFTLDGRGSSVYFLRLLIETGLQPGMIYVHNCWQRNGSTLLTPEIVNTLSPFAIVALGSEPLRWLEKYGKELKPMDVFNVKHPRQMRQFHYKELHQTALSLRKALSGCGVLFPNDVKFLDGVYDETLYKA